MTSPRPPHDESRAVAGLRFLLELLAWVFIYFAWGWTALAIAAAALLIFNVPGDKHLVAVPVRGSLRLFLEALVGGAGVLAAWTRFGAAPAIGLAIGWLALPYLSRRRYRWLLGADSTGES